MEEENKHPGSENLRPVRTTEEAKARGKQGGIKSGQAKREKKLLSEIYAEVIAEMYGVDCEEGQSSKDIVKSILLRKDSAAVSMFKELREATEGSKIDVSVNPLSEFIKNLRQQ